MDSPTLNSQAVKSATISEPVVGPWHIRPVLDSETAFSGAVTFTADGQTWVGTTIRSKAKHGVARGLVAGGAGGIGRKLDAKHYHSVTMATIVGDLLAEAKGPTGASEQLDSSVTDLASFTVPNWQRDEGLASEALTAACAHMGRVWRILRTGKVWIGTPTWPAYAGKGEPQDSDWCSGVYFLLDAIDLQPGVLYDGEQIKQVTHSVDAKGVRTIACVISDSGVVDRQYERLTREIDRSRAWPARVTAQAAIGTLEIQPDDARVRGNGLSPVAYLAGLPGATVEVPPGVRGLYTLAGGDPSRPRWFAWEAGCPALKVTLTTTQEIILDSVSIKLGLSATEKAVLGDLFMQLYNAHTHPTGMGPSGPPAVLMSTSQLATKTKVS